MNKIFLIIFLSVFLSDVAFARSSVRDQTYLAHVYYGFGEAYSVSDFRLGFNNFEMGRMLTSFYGINYLHNLNDNFYISFGGGLVSDSSKMHISPYAAVGVEFWKLYIINFRTEIGMYSNLENYTGGAITFGINVGI
jgi:hypothetical protein